MNSKHQTSNIFLIDYQLATTFYLPTLKLTMALISGSTHFASAAIHAILWQSPAGCSLHQWWEFFPWINLGYLTKEGVHQVSINVLHDYIWKRYELFIKYKWVTPAPMGYGIRTTILAGAKGSSNIICAASTTILSPTKRCVWQISVVKFVILLKF